ncbi:MAG: flagellar basal body P-ring formation protein FlgA [Magnetococcales bacterium]|nr:flagellar basal body P-ring formation protein FlgA [Magnetococcales bacterium]
MVGFDKHAWKLLILPVAVLWSGSVWGVGLDQEALTRLVEQHLTVALDAAGDGLKAERVFVRQGTEAGEGGGTLDLLFDPPADALRAGRVNLMVTVLEDDRPRDQVRAVVTLKQERKILVPRRNLTRGEVVGPGDLAVKLFTLAREQPELLGPEQGDAVLGRMATRTLQADRPLQADWFELPLAVTRGDRVRVRLVRKGLNIETIGIAGRHGRVGDAIEVRNPDSQRAYVARILGPGQVQVMMP